MWLLINKDISRTNSQCCYISHIGITYTCIITSHIIIIRSLLPISFSTYKFLTKSNANRFCLSTAIVCCVLIAHNNDLRYHVISV